MSREAVRGFFENKNKKIIYKKEIVKITISFLFLGGAEVKL